MTRRALILLLALSAPVQAEAAEDDYRKLMRSYIDTFRIFGRSTICRLDFDAEPHFREVARRHGENSEPLKIARLAYTSGTENLMLPHELYPAPPAPMPCDVMVHMKGMGLPALPASLTGTR